VILRGGDSGKPPPVQKIVQFSALFVRSQACVHQNPVDLGLLKHRFRRAVTQRCQSIHEIQGLALQAGGKAYFGHDQGESLLEGRWPRSDSFRGSERQACLAELDTQPRVKGMKAEIAPQDMRVGGQAESRHVARKDGFFRQPASVSQGEQHPSCLKRTQRTVR
jgi:hypothetical protein